MHMQLHLHLCPFLYLHLQVTTDNGGGPWDSNVPLRGTKETLFEGGIRGAAFVHSPLLGRRGEWRGLMHLVDWVPTLLGVAGLTPPPGLDGRDLWQAIRCCNESSTRRKIHLFFFLLC